MRSFLQSIFVALISIMLYSCGQNIDTEDKTPPVKPVFKSKLYNIDTAMVESGIDAVSDGDYIYLEWKPNSESDLLGYIVERLDPDSSNWLQQGSILAKNDTSYYDMSDGLIDDNNSSKFYSYRLIAVDESGNRSQPSFPEKYRLLPKVNISEFSKHGNDSLKAVCTYQGDYNSIYFIFRFYEDNKIIAVEHRPILIQSNYNTFYFIDKFHTDNLALRVDAVSSLRKGSESFIRQLKK